MRSFRMTRSFRVIGGFRGLGRLVLMRLLRSLGFLVVFLLGSG
jgi:hypothetical protein